MIDLNDKLITDNTLNNCFCIYCIDVYRLDTLLIKIKKQKKKYETSQV